MLNSFQEIYWRYEKVLLNCQSSGEAETKKIKKLCSKQSKNECKMWRLEVNESIEIRDKEKVELLIYWKQKQKKPWKNE